MLVAVASGVVRRGPSVASSIRCMVPSSVNESGTKIPASGVCYHCSTKAITTTDGRMLIEQPDGRYRPAESQTTGHGWTG